MDPFSIYKYIIPKKLICIQIKVFRYILSLILEILKKYEKNDLMKKDLIHPRFDTLESCMPAAHANH